MKQSEPRLFPNDHPLVRLVMESITHLRRIKARLPFLMAVATEARRASPHDGSVRNDIVVRMFHDSSDMLVIDLCSLRESVTTRGGMFLCLCQHNHRLRRFRDRDIQVEGWLEHERSRIIESWNEHFDFLFPDGAPSTHAHIDALIQRFLTATEATELDRNKARAHRYEEDPSVAAQHVQTFEGVQAQIQVFDRYFHSMLWVLTGADYEMETPFFGSDEQETARDIVDIVFNGSIDDATVNYGMAPEHDMTRRYGFQRERFFAQGGVLGDVVATAIGPTKPPGRTGGGE